MKTKINNKVILTPAQKKASYVATGLLRNGKPVFLVPAKRVICNGSEFGIKQLCDGRTFSLGFACAFKCAFCYVKSVLSLHPGIIRILKETGLKFQDVIIEKESPLPVLARELLHKDGRPKYSDANDNQVIYSSTLIDVAANRDMINQTVEACKLILKYTHWDIRLLSKSAGLRIIAELLSAYRDRMIFGLSIGTLDDRLAASFECGTSSPSARLRTLRWLQENGFRTYGMTCPSLPQQDYDSFATQMADAIRVDRCEQNWAEVLNIRGQSFTRTFEALMAGGFTAEAEQLRQVNMAPEAWENYSRATFLGHTKVVPPEKLRFLQYVAKGQREWWQENAWRGALLLGKHATPALESNGQDQPNSK